MAMMEVLLEARTLIAETSHGVLSTISVKLEGFPFGSVVPFCSDNNGWPMILISEIAEHTTNIKSNQGVSLTILAQNEGNVQAKGRITIVGTAELVRGEDELKERYYRHFPQSRAYHTVHDFSFHRIEPRAIHYIGGFGAIHWINPKDFFQVNPFHGKQEIQIINHMNDDHRKDLILYCTYCRNIKVSADDIISMCGIDADGFDVLFNQQKIRFNFESKISTVADAREAMVKMSKSSVPRG